MLCNSVFHFFNVNLFFFLAHGIGFGSSFGVLHFCCSSYFHCNVSSGWHCPAIHKKPGKRAHCSHCLVLGMSYKELITQYLF